MVSPAKVSKNEDSVNVEEFQSSIEAIDEIQTEIEKLNEQASEEILKIDQKYDKLRQPFYKKRHEHIAKIPNFWYRTLVNHPQISSIITEEDEEILKHLTEIEVVELEDAKQGFRVNFHFEPNAFFENTVLSRDIVLSEDGSKSATCEIKWKERKNPFEKKKAAGRKRPALNDSFFCWFTTQGSEGDEGEGMVIDEIGEYIKEELWSNPLNFLVEGEDDEGSAGGLDEMSDEEDDDDDDDDGDDGEDDAE